MTRQSLTLLTLRLAYSQTYIYGKETVMLVLARKTGESLIIQTSTGEEIEIVVLKIKGNQVQIGTEAPCDVSVYREEVFARINNEYAEVSAG